MIVKRNILFLLSSLCAINLLCSCSNGNSNTKNNTDTAEIVEDFVPMFSTNSLEGWEGDTSIWQMTDGVLIGEIKEGAEPLKSNTFLIWKKAEPADFELKGMFKVSASGNSGINYRSDLVSDIPHALKGYQADIDGKNNYTGQNYEERKRTTLAYRGQVVEIPNTATGESKNNAWTNVTILDSLGSKDELKALIKSEDWNEIRIVAKGTKLEHYINGKLMSSVDDKDPVNSKSKGSIGLQVHVGPPMKVEYRDLVIKNL